MTSSLTGIQKQSAPNTCRNAMLLVVLLLASSACAQTAIADGEKPKGFIQDILFMHPSSPVFIRCYLQAGDQPVDVRWKKYTAQLHKRLDKDSDGAWSVDEINAASKEESLPLLAITRRTDLWQADIDPFDKTISVTELQSFLIRKKEGPFQSLTMTSGTTGSSRVGEALFERMDANENNELDPSEFKSAHKSMRKIDLNDDGSFDVSELSDVRPNVNYRQSSESSVGGPFYLLGPGQPLNEVMSDLSRRYQPDSADIRTHVLGVAKERIAAYDYDSSGGLDYYELLRLLRNPVPSVEIAVQLNHKSNDSSGIKVLAVHSDSVSVRKSDTLLALAINGVQIELTSNQDGVDRIRRYLLTQFKNHDRDNNDYVDKKEAGTGRVFADAFELLDADGDEKLFMDELKKAIDARAEVAITRTRATVVDRGRNFFQILDLDRSQSIGTREFKKAARRIPLWDDNKDSLIQQTEIPRMFQLSLGPGSPDFPGMTLPNLSVGGGRAGNVARSFTGPIWFQRMDRNKDNGLSRREFIGSAAEFRLLDTNNDQFVDSIEASEAKTP